MTAAHFEDHPTDPDKVILRKPKHEYVAFMDVPYKPWVELTLAEVEAAYHAHAKYQEEEMGTSGWVDFAVAIERILKEKNT